MGHCSQRPRRRNGRHAGKSRRPPCGDETLPVPTFVTQLLPGAVTSFRTTIPGHQVEGLAAAQDFTTVDIESTASSIWLRDGCEVQVVWPTQSASFAASNVDLLVVPGCGASFDDQNALIRKLDAQARRHG